MTAAAAPWPFVGRDAELARALDELADPASSGVLVLGPAGVGKTRLVGEVLARLAGEGRATARVVGATATQPIPFGAVAHLLPEASLRDRGPDPIGVFDAARARLAEAAAGGPRCVLGVDDIGLLDAPSLTLLVQLVNAGVASVLATARHSHPLPPAVTALEGNHRVGRIELKPLDVDGVNHLLEAVHGGTVDRRTSRELWRVSQGNALYLRELVLGALASGALVEEQGHWRLVGPLTTTSRLVDAVSSRLDGLDADARELAEVLAVAEPLRLDDVERAGLGDAAATLDDAGLLTATDVDDATVVRLAHPLYGEVLAGQVSPLRRRRLLLRAADVVSVGDRPTDTLRLATWLLGARVDVDVELLKEAARRARNANDFVLTEQLARAACARAPDLETLLLVAESLHEFGRIAEAEAVLADAAGHVENDTDRRRLAILHHRILLWGAGDAPASLEVLRAAEAAMAPGVERSVVRVAMANTFAFGDEPERALTAVGPEDLAEPLVALLDGFPRSIVLTRTGDPVAAAPVARAVREVLDGLPRQDRDYHPALLMLAEGLALDEAGELLAADEVVTAGYGIVVEQRIPQLHVWLSAMLGRVNLHRGRLATARRCFAESLAVATEARFGPGRRVALSGLAACAGQTGDVHASATLLAELDRTPRDVAFLAPQVHLGRAWALVALGRTTDALAALRQGADEAAAAGDATIQHDILYEAARIHADRALAHDIRRVAVTGRLAAARVEYVVGVAEGSLDALAEAEQRFAALGADLAASEAAAQLMGHLLARGRSRDAAAVQRRALEYAARLDGDPVTPALFHRREATPLTAREREIANLAARGMPTKAIARQLGVTPRTVSNHLQNAYVKLGISTRADLPEALGLHGD